MKRGRDIKVAVTLKVYYSMRKRFYYLNIIFNIHIMGLRSANDNGMQIRCTTSFCFVYPALGINTLSEVIIKPVSIYIVCNEVHISSYII